MCGRVGSRLLQVPLTWGHIMSKQNHPEHFLSCCPAKHILCFLSSLTPPVLWLSWFLVPLNQLRFSCFFPRCIMFHECHFVIFQLVCADSFYPHWCLQHYCLWILINQSTNYQRQALGFLGTAELMKGEGKALPAVSGVGSDSGGIEIIWAYAWSARIKFSFV